MVTKADFVDFAQLDERSAAEGLCRHLRFNGVPSLFEARALENGLESKHVVLVAKHLLHRARWVINQLPPTDAELTFLATRRLPGEPSNEAD